MSDDIKRKLILTLGFVCIAIFLYFVFVMGASFGCASGGGVMVKNGVGMRCIDINTTDLCRDYTGRVIEKPLSKFNFSLNMSAFNNSVGGV